MTSNVCGSNWRAFLLVVLFTPVMPVWAQYDDIIGFRVLSESQNEMVLHVQSNYSGSRGPTAYLSVLPTRNGAMTPNVGYSSGKCPTSNNLSIGYNDTCVTLSSNLGGQSFHTDGLQICLFGGQNRSNFYCKNLPHYKQWGSSAGYTNPGGPSSNQLVVNVGANPPSVSPGQQTTVAVYVHDGQNRPIPYASVTLSSGGGAFGRTGTTTVTGQTDNSGSFVGYWACLQCAPGYINNVRVVKPGYPEVNSQWRVQVR